MAASQGDTIPRDPPSSPTASDNSPSASPTPQTSSNSNSDSNPNLKSPLKHSATSYFTYPVSHVVSGIIRRLTDPHASPPIRSSSPSRNASSRIDKTMTSPPESAVVYTPKRTASPFQPPPLTPLTLSDPTQGNLQRQLLTRALAEEIRLLVPPRLQLVDTWRLAYSLDRDGASLATLYDNCDRFSHRSLRAGYVLVVRDSSPGGAVFGGYLTDKPHPSPHYYGTGECFLWRASVISSSPSFHHSLTGALGGLGSGPASDSKLDLSGLPSPPSADTTHMGRSTTLRGEKQGRNGQQTASTNEDGLLAPPNGSGGSVQSSGRSTPEPIRFKAFPYSGVNDYMIFCETGFFSLGGGDGHYGLWLDSSLEKGVSAPSQTFGNEPLSDEGTKFDILGVEVWYIGA